MKKVITLLIFTAILFIACNNTQSSTPATTTTGTTTDSTTTYNTQSIENTPIPNSKLGVIEDYSWNDFLLQGKVKKLVQYTYEVETDEEGNPVVGQQYDTPEKIEIIEFNPQGFVTRKRSFRGKITDTPSEDELFKYDSDNRLTSIKETTDDGKTIFKNYQYDNKGYLIAYERKVDDSYTDKIKYTTSLDASGNLQMKEYDETGSEYIVIYTYNKQNLLVTRESYNKEEKAIDSEVTYFYDSNNRIEKQEYKEFGSERLIFSFANCAFDKYGNRTYLKVRTNLYGSDETTEEHTQYTYDNKGNVLTALTTYTKVSVITGEKEPPTYLKYEIEYY